MPIKKYFFIKVCIYVPKKVSVWMFNNILKSLSECKVWRNPLNLFRGSEYIRYTWSTQKEPLTYYDMNLSAQDHQTFFTCEYDAGKPEYEGTVNFLYNYVPHTYPHPYPRRGDDIFAKSSIWQSAILISSSHLLSTRLTIKVTFIIFCMKDYCFNRLLGIAFEGSCWQV